MLKHIFAMTVLFILGSAAHAQLGGSRPGGGLPSIGGGNAPGSFGSGFGSGAPGGGFGAGGPGGGNIGNSLGSPAFSPYLNITRGGNSAALNYYGIVRPQQNLAGALQNLQQQVNGAANSNEEAQSQGIVVGTRVRFLNTGGYFQNMSGGTTTSSSLMGGNSLLGNNSSQSLQTIGGAGNQNLRGGFGASNGQFGTSGGGNSGGAPRGPR